MNREAWIKDFANSVLVDNYMAVKLCEPGFCEVPDSAGNIIYHIGLVVFQGPSCYKDDIFLETGPICKLGDYVVFRRDIGSSYSPDVYIIKDREVLGVIDDPYEHAEKKLKELKLLEESTISLEKQEYLTALKGKTITNVYMSDDQHDIVFKSDEGKYFLYEIATSCCEIIYIQSLSGIENLIGHKINEIDVKSFYPPKDEEVYEWPEYKEEHFFTLKTDKGHFDLEFRNEHSGSYGGLNFRTGINKYFHIDSYKEINKDF